MNSKGRTSEGGSRFATSAPVGLIARRYA